MDLLYGIVFFGAGVLCGAAVVGPKLYSAVTGTLHEMSHDLNPRRHPDV